MTRLLFDEYPLLISPTLAKEIGLNEAIVLQQIHYWIGVAKEDKHLKNHFKNGRWWTWNSAADWKKQFPFWSEATIRRAIDTLRSPVYGKNKDRPLIVVAQLAKNRYDKTLWYSIEYGIMTELAEAMINRCDQNDEMEDDDLGTSPSETSSETSSPFSSLTDSEFVSTEDRADTPFDGLVKPSKEEALPVVEEMLDNNGSCSDDNHAAATIPTVAKTTFSSHNSSTVENPTVVETQSRCQTSSPYCNPTSPKHDVTRGAIGYRKPSMARVDITSETEYVPCDEDVKVVKKRVLGGVSVKEVLANPRIAQLYPNMDKDEIVAEIVKLSKWLVFRKMREITGHPVVAYGKEQKFAQLLFSNYSPIEVISCCKWCHAKGQDELLNVWWNIKQFITREFKLPVDPRTLDDWERWPPHVQDKQLEEYREQVKEARVPWRGDG